MPAAARADAAAAAIADFRLRLSDSAQSILADDGESARSYALDVQNCILAFAGRVLLRGCGRPAVPTSHTPAALGGVGPTRTVPRPWVHSPEPACT